MVVKQTIKTALLSMADELAQITDYDDGKDAWADKMAQVIVDAILSAQVNAGIPVTTAGSATTQSGATTSTGTLS